MSAYNLKNFIDKDKIDARIVELAKELDAVYQGKDLLMVGILTGSYVLCADLARRMRSEPEMDFIKVSSYGDDTSGHDLRLLLDLKRDIKNRHVLLVDDIVDSGQTISRLSELLLARQPASLAVCALIDKKTRRQAEVQVDFPAFSIDNDYFLVGYGMDYAGKHRGLEALYEVIFEPVRAE